MLITPWAIELLDHSVAGRNRDSLVDLVVRLFDDQVQVNPGRIFLVEEAVSQRGMDHRQTDQFELVSRHSKLDFHLNPQKS